MATPSPLLAVNLIGVRGSKLTQGEVATLKDTERRKRRTREISEKLPTLVPRGIRLGIITRKDLDAISCEITRSEIPSSSKMSSNRDTVANTYNTVMDTNMGSLYSNVECTRCKCLGDECPGHSGKIMFVRTVNGIREPNPIVHPSYMDEILFILQSVHNKCSCLIIRNLVKAGRFGRRRGYDLLREIAKNSENQSCAFCRDGGTNPTYKNPNNNPLIIISHYSKSGPDFVVSPMEIYNIFKGISDEDAKLLGYLSEKNSNHPADLILFGIPVTPLRIRRPVNRNNVIEEDDFTKHYAAISKVAIEIRQFDPLKETRGNLSMDTVLQNIENTYQNLTSNLTELVYNMIEGGGQTRNDIQTMNSYKKLLNSKEGAFRSSLNAHNVDFCARTVAAPGPELRVDEVGLPESYAPVLTFPVKACDNQWIDGVLTSNLDYLNKLLRDGKVSIIQRGGRKITITDANRQRETITYGDIVQRHMLDGDMVYVNRNPSLHGASFRALRVRLLPIQTIMVNPALAKGFALDFDGDELNIHFPQTIEAQTEMQLLTSPVHCLTSEARGGVLVAGIIDTLTGAYLMTSLGVDIDRETWLSGFSTLNAGTYDLEEFIDRANRNRYRFNNGRGLFSVLFPPDLRYKAPLKEQQVWKIGDREIIEKELVIEDGLLKSGAITDQHIGVNGNLALYLIQIYGGNFYINFLSDLQWLTNWFLQYNGFSLGLNDCIPLKPDPEKLKRVEQFKNETFAKAREYGPRRENPLEESRRQANYINVINDMRERITSLYRENTNASALNIMSRSGAKGNELNAVMMTYMIGLQTINERLIEGSLGEGVNARISPFYPIGSDNPGDLGVCDRGFGQGLTPQQSFVHSQETRSSIARGKTNVPKSGYLERRLVKVSEDAVISNSQGLVIRGVPSSNNTVIQYVYGGIGLSAAKLNLTKDEFGSFYTYFDAKNTINQFNHKYNEEPLPISEEQLTEIVNGVIEPDFRFSPINNINDAVFTAQKNLIARQLRPLKTVRNPKFTQEIIEIIRGLFLKAYAPAGEAVGLRMATSIGEVATQLNLKQKTLVGTNSAKTLNTFDQTSALISMATSPKDRSSYIFFRPPIKLKEAYNHMKKFEYITLAKIVENIEPVSRTVAEEPWYQVWTALGYGNLDQPVVDYALRIRLNLQICYNYNIKVLDVVQVLNESVAQESIVVHSPNHIGIIDIYYPRHNDQYDDAKLLEHYRNVDIPQIYDLYFGGIKGITNVYPSVLAYNRCINSETLISPNRWRLTVDRILSRQYPINFKILAPLLVDLGFTIEEQRKEIMVVSSSDNIGPRSRLVEDMKILENFDKYNLIYLESNGTDLTEVLKIPGVDSFYTYSDNSKEMKKIFGIVPAQQMFYHTFSQTLNTVSPIHSLLLSDITHRTGNPVGINLAGAGTSNSGEALALASFEQGTLNVTRGALQGKEEAMNVNPSIMIGQPAPLGTGLVSIITPQSVYNEMSRLYDIAKTGENPILTSVTNTEEDELSGNRLLDSIGRTPLAVNRLLPPPTTVLTVPRRNTAIAQPPANVQPLAPLATPKIKGPGAPNVFKINVSGGISTPTANTTQRTNTNLPSVTSGGPKTLGRSTKLSGNPLLGFTKK
jgi:DNA-directed RNA polymerase beta' subunit